MSPPPAGQPKKFWPKLMEVEKGMTMAGGGSLLRGIDKLISEETGMPVWVTEKPMEAVVRGAGKVLEDESLLRKVRVVGGLR